MRLKKHENTEIKEEKEEIPMYELFGSAVNIAFYVLAAVAIVSAIIKIVKSKKANDKDKKD